MRTFLTSHMMSFFRLLNASLKFNMYQMSIASLSERVMTGNNTSVNNADMINTENTRNKPKTIIVENGKKYEKSFQKRKAKRF